MSDILDRAEKYLEDFGSSGKVADCLVQELVEALKNTSDALGFVEQCRKDWAKHTIVLQKQIEQMEKQEPAVIGVFVGNECVECGVDEKHAKERAKLWNNPTFKPLYELPNKV